LSEIVSLQEDRDEALRRAGLAVRAGELVVVPTDTVYGLAADAFNKVASARIFDIKQRPRSLPLPVLVSRPRQAWALCSFVPPAASALAAAYWPGPLTMVLPQTAELEWDLGDAKGSIALRMPAHEDLIALLEMVGPMATTSANLSGEPTASTIEEIQAALGDQVAVYIDGGPAKLETGSTIVDLTSKKMRVLREGPISHEEIERVTGERAKRA
jgi:tRNA threonylcarbamoyl adenosine modification protein (Sua5/YciO/YrdC/YwlC family)